MNKTTQIIIAVIVVIIILVGIWYGVSKKPQAPVSKEPIKIGATLALSGKYSYIGQAELRGLEMAINEINEQGGINGRKIELIVEDNKGDAKEAVNNVNKLINIDNVDIIFSAFTHITNAIKQIVFDKEKLLFYASTIADIAAENKYAFRDFYDAKSHGEKLAQKINEYGHKNVAFITEISDQCKEFENSFRTKANELGIKIIAREEYQVEATDLKTNLLKLNLKNADALVACAWRHEHILMKQLMEMGLINIPTFHWVAPYLPIANTKEMRELYEKNGAISSWYGFGETKNKESQEIFISKYKEKYNEEPIPDAAYFYDDVYIIANAIKQCGDIKNKDCVANKIIETEYDGVGGRVKFDNNGSAVRDVIFIAVKNGRWEVLK